MKQGKKFTKKERCKFLYSDDMIIYIENPQKSLKQLWFLVNLAKSVATRLILKNLFLYPSSRKAFKNCSATRTSKIIYMNKLNKRYARNPHWNLNKIAEKLKKN